MPTPEIKKKITRIKRARAKQTDENIRKKQNYNKKKNKHNVENQ